MDRWRTFAFRWSVSTLTEIPKFAAPPRTRSVRPSPAPFERRLCKPYMKSLIRGSSPYPIRGPPPRPARAAPKTPPDRADPRGGSGSALGASPNQATMILIDAGEAPTKVWAPACPLRRARGTASSARENSDARAKSAERDDGVGPPAHRRTLRLNSMCVRAKKNGKRKVRKSIRFFGPSRRDLRLMMLSVAGRCPRRGGGTWARCPGRPSVTGRAAARAAGHGWVRTGPPRPRLARRAARATASRTTHPPNQPTDRQLSPARLPRPRPPQASPGARKESRGPAAPHFFLFWSYRSYRGYIVLNAISEPRRGPTWVSREP